MRMDEMAGLYGVGLYGVVRGGARNLHCHCQKSEKAKRIEPENAILHSLLIRLIRAPSVAPSSW
jgi:hypothetical protein